MEGSVREFNSAAAHAVNVFGSGLDGTLFPDPLLLRRGNPNQIQIDVAHRRACPDRPAPGQQEASPLIRQDTAYAQLGRIDEVSDRWIDHRRSVRWASM